MRAVTVTGDSSKESYWPCMLHICYGLAHAHTLDHVGDGQAAQIQQRLDVQVVGRLCTGAPYRSGCTTRMQQAGQGARMA